MAKKLSKNDKRAIDALIAESLGIPFIERELYGNLIYIIADGNEDDPGKRKHVPHYTSNLHDAQGFLTPGMALVYEGDQWALKTTAEVQYQRTTLARDVDPAMAVCRWKFPELFRS